MTIKVKIEYIQWKELKNKQISIAKGSTTKLKVESFNKDKQKENLKSNLKKPLPPLLFRHMTNSLENAKSCIVNQ